MLELIEKIEVAGNLCCEQLSTNGLLPFSRDVQNVFFLQIRFLFSYNVRIFNKKITEIFQPKATIFLQNRCHYSSTKITAELLGLLS